MQIADAITLVAYRAGRSASGTMLWVHASMQLVHARTRNGDDTHTQSADNAATLDNATNLWFC